MNDKPNFQRVTTALTMTADALAPFLERELKRTGMGWWTERVLPNVSPEGRQRLPSVPPRGTTGVLKVLDLTDLLLLLARNASVLKGGRMKREVRTYAEELRSARNEWAHRPATGKDIAPERANRILDTASLLLDEVDPSAAAAVRALRDAVDPPRGPQPGDPNGGNLPVPTPLPGPTGGFAGLRPWRDAATPREDVRTGRLTKDQFAADLHEVFRGNPAVSEEYRDAREFFDRTYVTEGLRAFLKTALERLTGAGGQPVVQLKTGFGGGKTHTMLALYHMARSGADLVNDVPVLKELSQEVGVAIPRAKTAVLVGTKLSPTAPWDDEPELKSLGISLKTLWGHLAWQLGGWESYKLVQTADDSGVAPGEELRKVLERAAPCVILIDELVAYGRKLKKGIPGGTLESNMSFVQTLTELAKATPGVVVAASIPESEMEIGGPQGQQVLQRFQQIFGRLETPWQPVGAQEAFEVVRRRLFEKVDPDARDQAVATFAAYYRDNPGDFPPETRERAYEDRMRSAFPFHPEVFDRLYQDWATMPEFQSTRGVLRLLAGAVQALWQDGDASPVIMPGTLQLSAPAVREEVLRYLPEGFGAVLDADIDGATSKAVQIDAENPRFGRVGAARATARAILLGSAPAKAVHGVEEVRVMLGAARPGEPTATYLNALHRLRDRLEYLHTSGQRYWFDVRPNLNRIVADRMSRVTEEQALNLAIDRLRKDADRGGFAAKHVAPIETGDVPDDSTLRLVIISPGHPYGADDGANQAVTWAGRLLEHRGSAPRLHRNMVVFAAFDEEQVPQLIEQAKLYIAWESVLQEKQNLRLNGDQERQAKEAVEKGSSSIDALLQQGYRWVLAPDPSEPGADRADPAQRFHATDMSARLGAAGPLAQRVMAALQAEEACLDRWSPYFLKEMLDRWFWRDGVDHISIKKLWEENLTRYPYLQRLASREVLIRTVQEGAANTDYFGYADGFDGERYLGLKFGSRPASVNYDERAVIVRKEVAERLVAVHISEPLGATGSGESLESNGKSGPSSPAPPKRYWGRAKLPSTRVASQARQIAEEIVQHLNAAGGDVEVVLEISARFRDGLSDDAKRIVATNSQQLGLDFGFEEQ